MHLSNEERIVKLHDTFTECKSGTRFEFNLNQCTSKHEMLVEFNEDMAELVFSASQETL